MIDNNPLKSHCAQYIVPVGLVFGQVLIDDILFDRQRHPEVARLSAGMALVHGATLGANYPERYTSIVELTLKDGRARSRQVEHAKGARDNPLAPEEVVAKYFRLTRPVIPRPRATAIKTLVDRLAHARDLRRLGVLLRRKTGRSPRATSSGRARTAG